MSKETQSPEKVYVGLGQHQKQRQRKGKVGLMENSKQLIGTAFLTLFDEPPSACLALGQWFSTFLMPLPFNTVPHGVVTPNPNIDSLLFCNCNFATIMYYNINI